MKRKGIIWNLLGMILLSAITVGLTTNKHSRGSLKGNSLQSVPDSSILIGTWIGVHDSNLKRIFLKNGIEKEYYSGKLTATYHWSIKKYKTPSGLTIPNLIEQAVEDSKTIYKPVVGFVDDKHMVLTYQIGGHISKIFLVKQDGSSP